MPERQPEAVNLTIFDDASAEAVEMKPFLPELLGQALQKDYHTKLTELPAYQAARAQDAAYQGRLALALATAMRRCAQADYRARYTLAELLGGLLRGTLGLGEADYLQLFRLYGLAPDARPATLELWPFPWGLTLAQVGRLAKKQGQLSPPMLALLAELLEATSSGQGDGAKLNLKVQEVRNLAGAGAAPTITFAEGDPLGRQLAGFVAGLDPAAAATAAWLRLLQLWQKASGGQPTASYRKELATTTAALGAAAVRAQGRAWLDTLGTMPVVEETQTIHYPNDYNYTYTSYTYLLDANAPVAKGLVWTMQPLADAGVLAQLTTLAAKCFGKIPGKGPLAAALGNACLLALSQNGLPGVAALARVRSKIRQTNTQETIARYIAQESAKLGVSPAEIEDMAAPDFGLENGRLTEEFGEYTATATLTLSNGKAEMQWHKAGKPLKSAPPPSRPPTPTSSRS